MEPAITKCVCALAGYANEVGESFRSLVHVNVVRFSYVLSTAYVCADAIHKGDQAYKVSEVLKCHAASFVI